MLRVALIGRPNVGKSRLFNRLIGRRIAIVEDLPGVTRDRHSAVGYLEDTPYLLIDTGGFLAQTEGLEAQVAQQVRFAVAEVDIVLWVVDAQTGLLPEDLDLAAWLRKHLPPHKTLWLVVNKADDPQKEIAGSEAYEIGLEQVFFVSAANGRGLSALKSALAQHSGPQTSSSLPEGPRFALIGRPNVGKSSLFNRLLGEGRAIVSDTPGTTRDALYMPATWQGHAFFWVDTAGLRRKSHIEAHTIERYAALRSLEALHLSEVVLLVMDATEALTGQDLNLIRLVEKQGKGLVLLLNKVDLVEKTLRPDLLRWVRRKVLPLEEVPIIFTSALTGEGLRQIPAEAFRVYEAGQHFIPTRQLNEVLRPILRSHPHPAVGTLRPAVKLIQQVGTSPPRFLLHVRHKGKIRPSYVQFIGRQIRRAIFGYAGWAIRFELREG